MAQPAIKYLKPSNGSMNKDIIQLLKHLIDEDNPIQEKLGSLELTAKNIVHKIYEYTGAELAILHRKLLKRRSEYEEGSFRRKVIKFLIDCVENYMKETGIPSVAKVGKSLMTGTSNWAKMQDRAYKQFSKMQGRTDLVDGPPTRRRVRDLDNLDDLSLIRTNGLFYAPWLTAEERAAYITTIDQELAEATMEQPQPETRLSNLQALKQHIQNAPMKPRIRVKFYNAVDLVQNVQNPQPRPKPNPKPRAPRPPQVRIPKPVVYQPLSEGEKSHFNNVLSEMVGALPAEKGDLKKCLRELQQHVQNNQAQWYPKGQRNPQIRQLVPNTRVRKGPRMTKEQYQNKVSLENITSGVPCPSKAAIQAHFQNKKYFPDRQPLLGQPNGKTIYKSKATKEQLCAHIKEVNS